MEKYFIYKLSDPIDFKIKYIGITKNQKLRAKDHRTVKFAKHTIQNPKFYTWLSILKSNGLCPKFEVIKECENKEIALKLEAMLIKKLSNDVLNILHNKQKLNVAML